jgi:hypothetical protein
VSEATGAFTYLSDDGRFRRLAMTLLDPDPGCAAFELEKSLGEGFDSQPHGSGGSHHHDPLFRWS